MSEVLTRVAASQEPIVELCGTDVLAMRWLFEHIYRITESTPSFVPRDTPLYGIRPVVPDASDWAGRRWYTSRSAAERMLEAGV